MGVGQDLATNKQLPQPGRSTQPGFYTNTLHEYQLAMKYAHAPVVWHVIPCPTTPTPFKKGVKKRPGNPRIQEMHREETLRSVGEVGAEKRLGGCRQERRGMDTEKREGNSGLGGRTVLGKLAQGSHQQAP